MYNRRKDPCNMDRHGNIYIFDAYGLFFCLRYFIDVYGLFMCRVGVNVPGS
jgi:hypothetical protein